MEEKKPKKKKTIADHILTFILVIAVGVFCYAGYKLVSIYMEYKEGTDEYNQIAQIAVTVQENEEEQNNEEDNDETVVENAERQEKELEKPAIAEEPGENSYAATGEQLAEQVIALLKEIAETESQIQKKQVGEQEKANSVGATVSEVLTKPEKEENVLDAAENVEVTGAAEKEDKMTESLQKEKVYTETEENVVSVETKNMEGKQEKAPTREELLENLQNIIERISSIIEENSLSEHTYVRNDVVTFIADRITDATLPITGSVVFSLKKLSDIFSEVTEGLDYAAEIRKNGPGIDVPLKVDFRVLQEINEDVIGWLYVEAIDSINYPIVKGEDNDEYLHHTYEGKYNFAGTIFIDCENSRDFKDSNTLVYGHNMKNGSMFGQLKSFVNKAETYEKSKYFWILTPDADYRYEIIAAYTTGVKSDTYTLFKNPGEKFLNYIEKIREWSAIETTSHKFTVRDKIVTLSTCTGNESTRFVVQGVRVNTISK